MKASLGSNKDFLAGLLLLGVGALAFFVALDYPFGSSLRMGPGYFPRVLAGILMAFGAFVLIRGLMTGERVKGIWGWKPLAWISLSLIAFGFTMDKLGFIPALLALFLIAAMAGRDFKPLQVAAMTAVMGTFAVLVFVYLLGLPYPLIQGF